MRRAERRVSCIGLIAAGTEQPENGNKQQETGTRKTHKNGTPHFSEDCRRDNLKWLTKIAIHKSVFRKIGERESASKAKQYRKNRLYAESPQARSITPANQQIYTPERKRNHRHQY